ncbi:MAG: hypothetical protein M3Q57_09480 [Pseudomonadota bacterium]|nr:hypothetical protein [Pseudomonadota bacterium]
MKLYRVNKLAKPGGAIIKIRHMLAADDRAAVREARESVDCPICDVLTDGRRVGSIV